MGWITIAGNSIGSRGDEMILERDYQIFVSYRRIGGEYAAQYLKTELSNMGYRVFLDVQDLGDGDFSKDIEKAIGQCRVLLVILSEGIFRNTLENPEKDWIIKEYSVVKERKQNQEDVKIIPVRLRNYQEPDKEEIRRQAEHLPEDGGILQKKKECLNNFIELLNCNYIPFTDTRYSGAVLNRLILWMQLKPADEEELRKKAENNPAAMNELGMMYEYGNVAGSGRDGLKDTGTTGRRNLTGMPARRRCTTWGIFMKNAVKIPPCWKSTEWMTIKDGIFRGKKSWRI